MRPAGLAEVEAAKADGRWEAAYEGQRTAKVPDDLQRELDANRGRARVLRRASTAPTATRSSTGWTTPRSRRRGSGACANSSPCWSAARRSTEPSRRSARPLPTLGRVDRALLDSTLADAGEPSYRASQVWEWVARGAGSYEEMTNLPAALRERLAAAVPLSTLALEAEAKSDDGTVKALFHTADGRPIEAVLMRYRDGRRSVCLSSQSGCPLTCTFCATGQMKFGRNLSADEILDQALHFRRTEAIDHVVFMGMGEPTMNLDAVLAACERLPDLGVTHRRTAISTVGWVPGIDRLAECEMPVSLALSLHAPNDGLRSQLMPVNDRYPLAEVLAACERYRARRRRKVFVEYVMLDGVNDQPEHARQLAALLDPRVYKVNLIPYNPTGAYDGSSPERIERFRAILAEHRLTATVRLTRGRDIDAACGQLAASAARPQLPEPQTGSPGLASQPTKMPPMPVDTAAPGPSRRSCLPTRCGGLPTTCVPSGGRAASTHPGPATSASAAPIRSPMTRCRCCSAPTKSTGRSSACASCTPGSSSCSARRPTTSSPSRTRRTSTGARAASAT